MFTEAPLFANALLYLLALSSQLGWFEDLFDDDDEAEDPFLLLPEDTAVSSLFDDSLFDQPVWGTAGADVISADADDSTQAYFLSAGNDQVVATDTNDYAQGGSGDDTLTMLSGDDLALGGSGEDVLFGGIGDDTLYGDAGNDRIDGSRDNDILHGGDGDDTLTGGREDDTLFGGAGNDLLSGDRLDEDSGILRGTDFLDGGDGDDTLRLFGDSTGVGGAGSDLFSVHESDPDQDGANGNLAVINDYDPAEDAIEVRYQESPGQPAPDLTVATASNGFDSEILLDGEAIATVQGIDDLDPGDILLAPI